MRTEHELRQALDGLTRARAELEGSTSEAAYIAGTIAALRWALGEVDDLSS